MKRAFRLLAVVLVVGALALAQDTASNQPAKKDNPATQPTAHKTAYRVDFKIYELEDGKRTNQRDYSMVASTRSGFASLKVGTRVPITMQEKQASYMNVGIELGCRLAEDDGKLWASFDIDVSSFALPEQNADPRAGGMPVLRNAHQSAETSLQSGKPVLIASIDDPSSKKRLQVEVTATRLD